MKKFLIYILIVLTLVGLFGPVQKVQAQEETGSCQKWNLELGQWITQATGVLKKDCPDIQDPNNPENNQRWVASSNTVDPFIVTCFYPETGEVEENVPVGTCRERGGVTEADLKPKNNGSGENGLEGVLSDACGVWGWDAWEACILQLIYLILYRIPAFILWITAFFFNIMIVITLDSALIQNSTFIPAAWAIMRDFCNIFFIFILLYIALKMVLDLGAHEAQRMIVKVVLVALLINFSMFATRIVIDSSNILALIFYNKIEIKTTDEEGNEVPYNSVRGETDAAGVLVNSFNPTKVLNEEFFKKFNEVQFRGKEVNEEHEDLPAGIIIGMTVVAGAIALFAAYAFFVAGISFLGRLIEFWILIIFSPVAFLSLVVPPLAHIEYLGWNDWKTRLVKVAFMAPIFMFLLYLIFLLVKANIHKSFIREEDQGAIEIILSMVIPALIIMSLLLKAAEFAKKGGGQFGEMLIKGGTVVAGVAGGLALGAASGGATLALGAGLGGQLGKLGGKVGNNYVGNKLKDFGSSLQTKSFDFRNTGAAKKLASATGIDFGKGREGGWTGMKTRMEEKRLKRHEELQKRGTGKAKAAVVDAEVALNNATLHNITATVAGTTATLPVKLHLENADKAIEKARIDLNDAKNANDLVGMATAKTALDDAKAEKETIRVAAGLKPLEQAVRLAKANVETTSHHIADEYASWIESQLSKNLNSIFRLGAYSRAGADETARKIRAGAH